MGKVIVIQFVTVDGVIQDPDGSGGTPAGGWAFRFGPEEITGDKFGVGEAMEHGALLFGRTTWELFATLWPGRTGDFPDRMNGARKVVASRTLVDVSKWNNSTVLGGSLVGAVAELQRDGDVIVMGSTSIIRELAAADLVDQYRLLVFPIVLGCGDRIFADGASAALRLMFVEQSGRLALIQYDVER